MSLGDKRLLVCQRAKVLMNRNSGSEEVKISSNEIVKKFIEIPF
jgi:hypothetical protein